MKKSRHTEELIAFVLKEAKTSIHVREVCIKIVVSETTFYI